MALEYQFQIGETKIIILYLHYDAYQAVLMWRIEISIELCCVVIREPD